MSVSDLLKLQEGSQRSMGVAAKVPGSAFNFRQEAFRDPCTGRHYLIVAHNASQFEPLKPYKRPERAVGVRVGGGVAEVDGRGCRGARLGVRARRGLQRHGRVRGQHHAIARQVRSRLRARLAVVDMHRQPCRVQQASVNVRCNSTWSKAVQVSTSQQECRASCHTQPLWVLRSDASTSISASRGWLP